MLFRIFRLRTLLMIVFALFAMALLNQLPADPVGRPVWINPAEVSPGPASMGGANVNP